MNKFIVFDLDGTLINTLDGIFSACKKFLKEFNYNFDYNENDVKSFIGNGSRKLFQRMTKSENIDEIQYKRFLKLYESEQYISKPFAHVVDTLKVLKSLNYEVLIYSNKPDSILQPLIKSCFKDIDFTYIQGQDPKYPCKPDPTLLNLILRKLNLDRNNGYYCGDSYVDVQTGINTGLKTILVTYGYGDLDYAKSFNPNYVIDDFSKILEVIS